MVGAIDFGGSKLLVGLVAEDGSVVASRQVASPIGEGPAAVADAAAALLRQLAAPATLRGVGSTVPGLADTEQGMVLYAPTHGWKNVPWRQLLAERLERPVAIENDVNACALAEARFGNARGISSLVWITISTGIGGALLFNGQLFRGRNGLAGEIGHVVVQEDGAPCGCGRRGCLEAEASARAIARKAAMMGLPADAAQVADLARSGDPRALQAWREAGTALGKAAAAILNVLDPEMLVFGGHVAHNLDLLMPAIRAAVQQRVIVPQRAVRLEATALGHEAALKGAATLVL